MNKAFTVFSIAAIFVLAMLAFSGCAQSGGAQQGAGAAQGGAAASAGGNEGAGAAGSGAAASGSGNGGGAANVFDPASMVSWDFSVLKASGVPVACDVQSEYGGTMQRTALFIQGDSVRTESDSEGRHFVTIMKGEDVYVTIFDYPGCDWVKFHSKPANASSRDVSVEYPQQGMEFSAPGSDDLEAEPASFNCTLASFGPSAFDTPGKVCEFADLLKATCSTLTDEAQREMCEQAVVN